MSVTREKKVQMRGVHDRADDRHGATAAHATGDAPTEAEHLGRPAGGWRRALFEIVFESDTPAGRGFDRALIVVILASVAVVILDSVDPIAKRWGPQLTTLEWGFTALFALEYAARLICVQRPLRYVTSFYGVIDLLAVVPTFLAAFVPSLAMLIDVRILRLLRIFRIFKLSHYAAEYHSLGSALRASRRKITVFLGFVVMVVLIAGTLMYVVEGAANGYTSIPVAIYWAISTMTTVGFGDIAPKTGLGRFIASLMMLVGWGILAVPTGIVTAEFSRQRDGEGHVLSALQDAGANAAQDPASSLECAACKAKGHAADASFCRCCGMRLRRTSSG